NIIQEGKGPNGLSVRFNGKHLGSAVSGTKAIAKALQSQNCPSDLLIGIGHGLMKKSGLEAIEKTLMSGKTASGLNLDFTEYRTNRFLDLNTKKRLVSLLEKNHIKQLAFVYIDRK